MAISPDIGPGKSPGLIPSLLLTSRTRATANHALYLKQTSSLITNRRTLLCPKTLGKEWEIIHIISKSETYQHELENLTQLTLDGEVEWKSTRPVSPNG